MNSEYMSTFLDSYRRIERALSTTIRIDHRQVDYIVVNRLISIRNSNAENQETVDKMDAVLRFFLTDEEFQKYVINKEALEDNE